jgi:RNA polymerase sigma factor (sigma-70 family)
VRYYHRERRDVDRELPLSGPVQATSAELDPEEVAVRRERAVRVMAAMERLASDPRLIITLRNLEDLPFAQVAARLGRPEEAARQLWVRAIRQLRAELGDEP